MRKGAWVLLVGLLALGVGFLTAARARDGDEKQKIKAARDAAPDVEKLADAVNNPAELKKLAEAVAKKYDDLLPIMWQMKPREGSRIIGKPGTFPNDSIELGLLMLAKKPPKADQLAAAAPDLTRMAEVICGIAEVTPAYGAKYTSRPGQLKQWNAFADDMSEWGHELLFVVKNRDDKSLPKVIARLNQSCNDCHTAFRDGDVLYDVEQAARAVKNPAELKTKAAALASSYPLDKLSWTFRPREKGGLGVRPSLDAAGPVFVPSPIGTKAIPAPGPGEAPKPVAAVPNGIEAELGALENAPPAAVQLAARTNDLQYMAEVVRVLAEATPGYAKEYASNDDDRKKWGGFSDDMKQGSDDLIAAVQAKHVQALQNALGKLNQSCKDCHAKFR